MSSRFLVLGAGTALPQPGRGCAGFALVRPGGRVLLVDCGPGTLRALANLGSGIEAIDAVLLSHEHLDHVGDLALLFFARRNPLLADAPEIELVGPVGTHDVVARAQALAGRSGPPERVLVREIAADGDAPIALAGLAVRSAATGHTPTALAYALEVDGVRLCYSGDCGEPQRLVALARGADLLVCECSSGDEAPLPGHLVPRDVVRLVEAARPARVLLTHAYPGLDPDEAAREVARSTRVAAAAARDGLGLRFEGGRVLGWPQTPEP